ncbi:MAG: phenylacetate--CoA ligase family protein [Chlorobium sp.]|nr:phenylacetate--CoA ligase family protein [Chlorobium sp.]
MTVFNKISNVLSPHIFVPIYNYLKKDHRAKYVNIIEEFNKKSLDEIRNYQLNRIRIIADYAFRTTKYYKILFEEIGIHDPVHLTWDDFFRIPLLTKDIIRKEQESLLSNNWIEKDLRRTATGGTTSSPVPFFSDWDSMYRKRSATIAFDKWLGYRPGDTIVYLWQARQDMLNLIGYKQKIINQLVHRHTFLPGSPLDDIVLEKYYHIFKKKQPFILQAYPNPLEIFAKYLEKSGYVVNVPVISSTAEPLSEHQRRLFEKVFGGKVYNWYGAREAGRISTECVYHDGMHINAHCLHLETKQGGYVKDKLGSIVLTDLWNTGMPLIRYEIGDLGIVSDSVCQCGCELPRLMEMVGRVSDTFVNSRQQKIPGVWFPNQFVKDSKEIKEMQIIQHDIGKFEIVVVPGVDYSVETEKWLKVRLDEFMLEDNIIKITLVTEIPRETSGKIRVCKNLL